MTVTVYSKPACVQCNATYKALDKNAIEHLSVDLSKDPDAFDLVVSLGHQAAPVVVVRDGDEIVNHWSGFNSENIKALAS